MKIKMYKVTVPGVEQNDKEFRVWADAWDYAIQQVNTPPYFAGVTVTEVQRYDRPRWEIARDGVRAVIEPEEGWRPDPTLAAVLRSTFGITIRRLD